MTTPQVTGPVFDGYLVHGRAEDQLAKLYPGGRDEYLTRGRASLAAAVANGFVLAACGAPLPRGTRPILARLRGEPALEVVANDLYADRSLRSVRLTIALPEDQVADDVVPSTRAAIARYCDKYLREVERTRRGEQWRNFGALAVGLLAIRDLDLQIVAGARDDAGRR
jgi:hypothetical protein